MMKRTWKIFFIIFLVLLVIGGLLIAIGYFTGGSVERMIEIFFGSRETFELTIQLLRHELAEIFALSL